MAQRVRNNNESGEEGRQLTRWSAARAVEARARAEAAVEKRIMNRSVNARGQRRGTKLKGGTGRHKGIEEANEVRKR